MSAQETLQDVLRDRAMSSSLGRLLLYPLGNTSSPVEVTYYDLYQKAKHISRIINSLDQFEIGHPVLLHFDDHWDTILWFWSVLFAGGLPVLSSPFSNIEDERRKHILALGALLESPMCFTRRRLLSQFGDSKGIYLYPVESLLEASEGVFDCPQVSKVPFEGYDYDRAHNSQSQGTYDTEASGYTGKEDLAMLMLTSGSTGNAKAVRFTHRQILAAIAGKAEVRLYPPEQPILNWIGLDHVAGLIEMHLQAIWLGIDQVHVSAADIVPSPKIFLTLLSRHRVGHGISRTFAPNFFLAKLVATGIEPGVADDEWDLSNLVGVASGGEPNDVHTCVAASSLLQKLGAPPKVIITGFGMTETCAGAIFNVDCPDYDVDRGYTVASVGKCMKGIEMRITRSGSTAGLANPGEPGNLEVRGPVVFTGYYRNEVATNQAFTSDNWFQTGDQGFIDSNGKLSLIGRAKEVININGVKMVTVDIEKAIKQAIGNDTAHLVVFPSKAAHTEQVTIAYVPKVYPLQDEEVANITRLATQACLISTATLPCVFALQEKSLFRLPVSTLGKISRQKMARLFENGDFTNDVEMHKDAMRRATAQMQKCSDRLLTKAETQLMDDVAEILDTTPEALGIYAEACLFDLGFTSMHVIKLKSRLKQRLGVELPVIQILKNPSIRWLAAHVEAEQSQSKALSSNTPVHAYDPVVVFRATGSKTPLWLIHPGIGEVLIFVRLAQCLATDDRPVFALRAAGFEPGQQRFESITEAVGVYMAAIRKQQPCGPYALAGYSYGAMLAFETAKQLKDQGEEVRFMGSFNLPPHIKNRMRQLNWNTCLLHLAHFLELMTEDMSDTFEADVEFCGLHRTEAMRRALAIADRVRLEELGLDTDTLGRWVDVAFGLQRMATDYEPSGEVDSIDVFHAIPLKAVERSHEAWLRNHLGQWVNFSRELPRYHAVQGTHYTLIGPSYVTDFATILMKALKARGI
ncbi:acetyl-CoA synthetase-like protein [Xylaria sp. FL0933]|nr:acetyl-CoA synthetase-like protein [Xylaria sp. FL0933]